MVYFQIYCLNLNQLYDLWLLIFAGILLCLGGTGLLSHRRLYGDFWDKGSAATVDRQNKIIDLYICIGEWSGNDF